ncbi:MAG: hypothetical protein ACD_3C00067G0014 [uncultured bacterium (gcode 4)]|uniref:30S ribosomal protein S21 n=1 Tax=uncultured bacterium (gcode 4) TaxID=1234023 RepID=K2GY25_9BACT|nr:MAG: hypothetical protein ACD_3C00067G0014 [uncultured bacterium (gcode 4)]
MLIYAIRNKSESNEKLVLRYKKMFFQTRIANKLRKERYAVKWLSERKLREKAIIREWYRALNNR